LKRANDHESALIAGTVQGIGTGLHPHQISERYLSGAIASLTPRTSTSLQISAQNCNSASRASKLERETIMSSTSLERQPLEAAAFRKELPNGIPEGTAFHTFRHSYNALIVQVGTDDPNKVKEVQIKLLRQGDKRTNDLTENRPRRFASVPAKHTSR
jgi:hypothetical protein